MTKHNRPIVIDNKLMVFKGEGVRGWEQKLKNKTKHALIKNINKLGNFRDSKVSKWHLKESQSQTGIAGCQETELHGFGDEPSYFVPSLGKEKPFRLLH